MVAGLASLRGKLALSVGQGIGMGYAVQSEHTMLLCPRPSIQS